MQDEQRPEFENEPGADGAPLNEDYDSAPDEELEPDEDGSPDEGLDRFGQAEDLPEEHVAEGDNSADDNAGEPA